MIESEGPSMSPAVAECSCSQARSRFPKIAEVVAYLETLKGRADLNVLSKLLSETKVSRCDLESACLFNPNGYKRNTIAKTEWFELLALCWRSGHCTPIHDHRGSSCAFRIVAGRGTEIRYKMTDSGLVCPVDSISMTPPYASAAQHEDIHQIQKSQ